MNELDNRVINYWTLRAKDFATVRRNELNDSISNRWLEEIQTHLPNRGSLKILDVGTGTGYFAILLSRLGHNVTGVDLTEAMLEEARRTCSLLKLDIKFLQIDAQNLSFNDNTFDVVLSRNLTWTLPNPEKAYREWYRVLKPGGVLLNFDADYATNVRNKNQQASYISQDEAYGHCGITKELEKENAEITLAMPASMLKRPEWDINILKKLHFRLIKLDVKVGQRILKKHDLSDASMFLISGIK